MNSRHLNSMGLLDARERAANAHCTRGGCRDTVTEEGTKRALARCRRLAFLEVVFDSGGAAPGTSALVHRENIVYC